MNDFNKYRGSFLQKDGSFANYPIKVGLMHREIIEDYCKNNKLQQTSEQAVLDNGDIYFRNANNGFFIIYMPPTLTDEQLYQLEVNSDIINNFQYLAVTKEQEQYEYSNDIWDNFSNEVIQSYFSKKR